MAHIDLSVAEHEAAHLVVGLALGLRLKRAVVERKAWRDMWIDGFTLFGDWRNHLAHGITSCAGIVWEARPGGNPTGAGGDLRLAREYLRPTTRGGSTARNIETGKRIAAEILAARKAVHARLARELCDGALGPKDIERLVVEG